MRDLSALCDIEFEELVADLFAADLGINVERFARGADGGIDLRWKLEDGRSGIGQCKHYPRSTFAQLRAAAKAEIPHLTALKPAVYRLVTSFDLTPGQKATLAGDLTPWLSGPDDVLGGRDVDGLITRFPAAEQAHPKLWLLSGTQLFWATHADIAERASALRARIEEVIPRYVTNASLAEAAALLDEHRTCVIAGLPGIGKTTLAYALVADAIKRGYEPIEVSEDIKEAWTAIRPDVPQVFLYDDFLGQLTFSERLGKNEDARLADFIVKLKDSKSKLLVMTTREYILQDAQRQYGRLAAIDENRRFVLELKDYTREDRARILYNHLWHGNLPARALAEVASGGCIPIVDHPNYIPRLIEFCTSEGFDKESRDYPGRVLEHLKHPEQLWQRAFEDHLTTVQQLLAVALATLPPRARLDDLRDAHEALCTHRGVGVTAAEFRNALQMMEGSFLQIGKDWGRSEVAFHNPSVRSFVLDWLGQDRALVADVVDSAVFFEQISRLHQYATGRRGPDVPAGAGSTALKASFGQVHVNVSACLSRLIESPSPDRSSHYNQDGELPVTNLLERRLHSILDMPADARPSGAWLTDQLAIATDSWRRGTGNKSRAVELLTTVGRGGAGLGVEVVRVANDALDKWLESDLSDLDEDWTPYLARLQDFHHVDLSSAWDVASRFEEFVQHQMDSHGPDIPSVGELMDIALTLGLDDLHQGLEERAAEQDRRDEYSAEQRPRDRRTDTPTQIGDDDLKTMFARLAPGPRPENP